MDWIIAVQVMFTLIEIMMNNLSNEENVQTNSILKFQILCSTRSECIMLMEFPTSFQHLQRTTSSISRQPWGALKTLSGETNVQCTNYAHFRIWTVDFIIERYTPTIEIRCCKTFKLIFCVNFNDWPSIPLDIFCYSNVVKRYSLDLYIHIYKDDNIRFKYLPTK